MRYFSEKEYGETLRENETISRSAWNGIKALLKDRVNDNSFATRYAHRCQYFNEPFAIDLDHLWAAIQGDIPTLREIPWNMSSLELPNTKGILEIIKFCWSSIGKPDINEGYGGVCDHYHLLFDREMGREEFGQDINRIFNLNGLAYRLTESGDIERPPYTVLSEELASVHLQTGDEELDGLLEKARAKFLNSDEEIRREALEALWDAWERIKSLDPGLNKKEAIKDLLDRASGPSSPKLRSRLETEASELTGIGNELRIRHSETSQEMLVRDEHIDYLFHRLFSLIQLILKTKDSN